MTRQVPGRHDRDESGAVAVMVAILSLLLFGMAAFATDFGVAYAKRQQMSTASDSAALAGVKQLSANLQAHPGWTCAQLVADDASRISTDPTKVANVAQTYVTTNAPAGTTITGGAAGVSVACVGPGAAEVTVPTTKVSDTIFGGVLGASKLTLNRTAKAALGPKGNVLGVRPIALCDLQVNDILAHVAADKAAGQTTYRHELVTVDKKWGASSAGCGSGGTSGSGNWGFLNLPPALSPCSGNKLEDVIQCGSGYAIHANPDGTYTLDGTTGNKGNGNGVSSAIQSIMDDIVVLPVFDSVTGSGTNASFNVTGLLTVKMCGYQTQNGNKQVTGACYVTTEPRNPGGVDNVKLVDESMQIQYVNYIPVGNFSSACGIGDSTCDFRTYVYGLTK